MLATATSTALGTASSTSSLHWSMVQQFMMRHTGNVLRDDQAYLMESRLQRVTKALGYTTVAELVSVACVPFAPAKLATAIVEALTTHETSFFRDSAFWRMMHNDVLIKLIERARNGRHIRIWCAACSTGQEPYSLAILLREMAPMQLGNFEIIATDIAEPTLEHARSGFYSSLEVNRGLDIKRLSACFAQATGGFRVKDEIARTITWKIHNLLGTNSEPANCDLVLCRNVLIYFNETDRASAMKRLIGAANRGGYIGLGSTESTREPGLTLLSSGLYLKS
jgi:chemotaxis protein methyltransferase CheR